MKTINGRRVLIALALGGFIATACSERPVTPAPTKVTPAVTPAPAVTLSGTISEVLPDGRFVKTEAVDTGSPLRYRLCATNTVTRGDTELDIALFRPGAAFPGPTLSGQVTAMIDGKQVPAAGTEIYFQTRAFGPDAYDVTDADGRYTFAAFHRSRECCTFPAATT